VLEEKYCNVFDEALYSIDKVRMPEKYDGWIIALVISLVEDPDLEFVSVAVRGDVAWRSPNNMVFPFSVFVVVHHVEKEYIVVDQFVPFTKHMIDKVYEDVPEVLAALEGMCQAEEFTKEIYADGS